jgi:hypothetical protein
MTNRIKTVDKACRLSLPGFSGDSGLLPVGPAKQINKDRGLAAFGPGEEGLLQSV